MTGKVTAEEEARRAGVSVRTIYRWRAQRHSGIDDTMTAGGASIIDTLTRQLEAKDKQIGDLNERLHELAVTLNRLALPPPSTSEPTDPDQARPRTDRRGGRFVSWLIVALVAALAVAAWWWALHTPPLTIPTKVQIRQVDTGGNRTHDRERAFVSACVRAVRTPRL